VLGGIASGYDPGLEVHDLWLQSFDFAVYFERGAGTVEIDRGFMIRLYDQALACSAFDMQAVQTHNST